MKQTTELEDNAEISYRCSHCGSNDMRQSGKDVKNRTPLEFLPDFAIVRCWCAAIGKANMTKAAKSCHEGKTRIRLLEPPSFEGIGHPIRQRPPMP